LSDQSKQAESTDPRVQVALREYLERVDRGEVVNRQDFLARHAEIAHALRSFFAAEEPFRNMEGTRISEGSAGISTRSIAVLGQETVHPRQKLDHPLGTIESGLAGQFGRYQIIRALGKGAMGTVYLALDTQLKRNVAIKTPHFEDDPTGELLKRFYREAEAAATLLNANICPVYDVGEIEGKHFISMAYIEGRPLSDVIHGADVIHGSKPPSERQMLIVVHKLAKALQQAHDRGIVHRDLKPANIMIDKQGEPIIMDFGLARKRRAEGEASLTQSGVILGSPAYMSPEQIEGDPESVGPASDQYSLGVVLYEMFTGQLPFRGSVVNVLAQVITKGPTPPSELRPGLDPRIEAVCLRMMSKKASDRFPSMKAVADQLATIVKSPAAANSLDKSPTASRPPVASTAAPGDAAASKVRKSLKPKALTESDLTSLHELVRKCLRRRDYDQMIQIIERIPEARRSESFQTLLEQARQKTDEISFLICEIDEADRLEDGRTALKKAEELLKVKPGHHRARAIQEKYSGYGDGGAGAARIGALQQFTKPWNEGGWIPWSVLAFGLLVFAGMYYGVVVIYLGRTAIVVDIKDPAVQVAVKGTTLTITGPDKESIKVEPGDHTLKINFGGFETTSESFSLKRGETKTVTVSIVDKHVVARLENEILPLTPSGHEGQEKQQRRDLGGRPEKEDNVVKDDRRTIATQTTRPSDGFVPMFNGVELSGWKAVPEQLGQWRVERGVLIGSGQTASHLYTERGDYKNFHLRAEVRINQGGDSGICFRTPLGPQVSGIEAQIVYAHDGRGNTGSLYVAGKGLVAHVTQAPARTNEWFQLDLMVENDRIITQVDGKTTADYTDASHRFVEGHIALQCNPHTVVEFRKIEIQELTPTSAAAPLPATDPDRRAAEAVLRLGGSVLVRTDGREQRIEAAQVLPESPFQLLNFNLDHNTQVNDEFVASLQGLTHLRVVSFQRSKQITDRAAEYLRKLTSLEEIWLRWTSATDGALAHLNQLEHLKGLFLEGLPITDVGLRHLEGMTQLVSLELGYTHVTDVGLVHLETLTNLENLNLGETGKGVTDAGLNHLRNLRRLQYLNLMRTAVTGAGLASLEGLTQLEVLQLDGTNVRGSGFEHLRNLVHLRQLLARKLDVTDGNLVHLQGLTALEELYLAQTKVSGPGLVNLKGLKRLRDLGLNKTQMTNSGLVHLKNLPQLQKLHLGGTLVTDAGLHYLKGLTNLVELDLKDTKVTAAGVEKLKKSLPTCRIISEAANP
jgi:serine/threonine protein kinase